MQTATAPTPIPGANFALRFCAWSIGLFGLLRLGWIEAHGVLPVTQLQGVVAERLSGLPALPVDVTLACSAADAVALCVGAVLAYPATWRMRLAGGATGLALIVALNILRIATLGHAAASPAWFNVLHVYAWPTLLLLAIAGYVFGWMRLAGAPPRGPVARTDDTPGPRRTIPHRFVLWTAALLVIFTMAAPWYLQSAIVLAVATSIAGAAAFALRLLGVEATATGNVLATARGAFLVTQECITTPLIPVAVAAIIAYVRPWRMRALWLLAVVPAFFALGIARLLVVALPPAIVASPLFLIHAFYQLLLAAACVCLAAAWRHGASRRAVDRAALGCAGATLLLYVLATPAERTLAAFLPGLADPQGAIALLPAFQVSLYLALCVATFTVAAWRPLVTGLVALVALQAVVFAALGFALRHGVAAPHVRDVRAWTLAVPVLIILALVHHERTRT